jgi:hypothetical protein
LSRHAAIVGLSPDAFKQRFQLNRGKRE